MREIRLVGYAHAILQKVCAVLAARIRAGPDREHSKATLADSGNLPVRSAWTNQRRVGCVAHDMFRLDDEKLDDFWECEALLDTAFGPGRFALSAYRLREGVEPVEGLCVVARDEFGSLAGLVRFWPVRVGESVRKALLLGPIAVHPTRQGEGLGSILIKEGMGRAGANGWRFIVLVGDAPYYSRFGFINCPSIRFPPPTNPARVLAAGLCGSDSFELAGEVKKWREA